MKPLLAVADVTHHYDGVLALGGVSLEVASGIFLAVLGPNGAGKSTLAQVMSGALRPSRGRLFIDGADVTARSGRRGLVDRGVAIIPEGRRLFGQLTITENLLLGAYGVGASRAETRRRMEAVMAHMPEAVRRGRDRAAVTLSGGEQQMLVIGRALMAAPRLMVIDEPSLGLAPILIDRVYDLLAGLRKDGVTIVVFEQLATHALRHADRIVVIDHGLIRHDGPVSDDATVEALRVGYLGQAEEAA
jgi:ABC-type branched-subunit amino acid transport system ATPase component